MSTEEQLPSIPYQQNHIYLSLSLNEAAVISGKLCLTATRETYIRSLASTVVNLTQRTSRSKGSPLSHRMRIITSDGSVPWQARVIVLCPSGWSAARFKEEATRLFAKNPWVAHVDYALTGPGEMHLPSLESDWDGKLAVP
jgi:hypothetical protein